jgi:hypothetical protein
MMKFDAGEAAVEVAVTQAMTADLVGAGILNPATVGEITPLEVANAHLEARAHGIAGVRPIDKLMDDVAAQIERAIERRRREATLELAANERRRTGEAA